MRNKVIVPVLAALLALGLLLAFWPAPHPPGDLAYWMQAIGTNNWSNPARQGNAEAQFFLGLTLIRTNLVQMVDRVPVLCEFPIVGRRFEHRTYAIDSSIRQEPLTEAYSWIRKSAAQRFAPAQAAEKLFTGRAGRPPQGPQTNSSPAATTWTR